MKKYLALFLLFSFSFAFAQNHFITDASYRAKVEKKFEQREKASVNRRTQLFGVMNKNLSTEEKEAMKFLFAYAPLCDLADYDGNFFLTQVRYALKARDAFSWGRKIPEVIFRHFVLPYRVNNENLDTARAVFFNELKDRVKNLSLKEAALEVNHWCLEKVTYRGTDIRTSAPLATVKTSLGRCGEESTFTVTALRSVGIPARQVYTPRWAHSDDNHAWVEVWVDGKWYYMGACEPEADLNMGWFTEPARRAMLVHTKVFGDYPEPAEIVNKGNEYTEINVIGNYADTKKIFVKVTNGAGKPVENAKVDFGLYNYAEFYPIASKPTDKKGMTYLTTGYGTLVVWASKNGEFGFKKIAIAGIDTLKLTLGNFNPKQENLTYDLYPPVEKTPYPVNNADRERNAERVKKENAIRQKYMDTFIDSTAAFKFAAENGLDKKLTWKYLHLSTGNYAEIISFLKDNAKENKDYAFELLGQISEKDLRDTKASILNDHLLNALAMKKKKNEGGEKFISDVLNPRVKNENMLAYRKLFQDGFKKLADADDNKTARNVRDWIVKNIKMNETENYYNLPITPAGVYSLKRSNAESRDIFFVAVCRSLGIPARLEPKLKVPQYFYNNGWLNVYFEKQSQAQPEYGYVIFKNGDPDSKIDPKYYTHFTIGKFEDGVYKTVDFETEPVLSSFKEPVKLETGHYRLITGNRRSDGAVFSNITFFDIKKGETYTAVVKLRQYDKAEKVLGRVDVNAGIEVDGKNLPLQSQFKKDNIIIGWVEPSKEPTRHTIVELGDLRAKFEDWGGSILFAVTRPNETEQFKKDNSEGLPKNVSYFNEKGNSLFRSIKGQLGIKDEPVYPLFVVINKRGDIVFSSQGYKIGTGEQLLRIIEK